MYIYIYEHTYIHTYFFTSALVETSSGSQRWEEEGEGGVGRRQAPKAKTGAHRHAPGKIIGGKAPGKTIGASEQ